MAISLLGFLTIDLVGGVVANFTKGTTHLYKSHTKKRYYFIALHSLEPLLLYFTFSDPDNLLPVLVLTIYTLVAACNR